MGNDNSKGSSKHSDINVSRNFDQIEEERLKHTFKTLCGGTKDALTQSDFENALFSALPEYGRLLFGKIGASSVSEEQFIAWGKSIVSLVTSSAQAQFYSTVFAQKESEITLQECQTLLVCCFKASMCVARSAAADITQAPELNAVLKSLFNNEDTISSGELNAWCNRHCKKIFEALHHYTTAVLRGDFSIGKHTAGASAEGDTAGSKLSESVLSPCLAWLLSCHLPSGYIPSFDHDIGGMDVFSSPLAGVMHPSGWQLLYSSNLHGAGKSRFVHHILHYKAPSVLLLTFEEHVYVVAADREWKEDVRRWGGDDCLLIQVTPTYRQMTGGAGLLWFNLEDRTAPKGLSVGRDTRTTFIEVDEELSNVKHYGVYCKLQTIEVWGCGGQKALSEQKGQQSWENQQAEKAKGRKLKLEDWRDNPDKQLLDMGGVVTEHTER